MITTTLNEIRILIKSPRLTYYSDVDHIFYIHDVFAELLKSLNKTKADDEPLTFQYIYDELGAENLIWIYGVIDKRSKPYFFDKSHSFYDRHSGRYDDDCLEKFAQIILEYVK